MKITYKEEIEKTMKESKYGEGKKIALVKVTREGKTILQKRKVGTTSKEKKVEKKPQEDKKESWFDKYKKYNLTKYPVGISEEDVLVDESGDVNSHWILKWIDPKTKKIVNSYSKEFLKRNAQVKWDRIKNIKSSQIQLVKDQSEKMVENSEDDKVKQSAAIIAIIAHTGLRPGDPTHFKFSGNRGISTLAPENVSIEGNKVSLNFIGKSYKENTSEFESEVLASYLTELKDSTEKGGFLFSSADRKSLNDTFREELGMKGLKLKDMRTYVATDLARKLLMEDELPPPPLPEDNKKTKKLIQSKLKTVFEKVSQKLNNTPAMAKTSYIHPAVLTYWLTNLGVNPEEFLKSEFTLDDVVESTEGLNIKYSDDAEIDSVDEDLVDYFVAPSWLFD